MRGSFFFSSLCLAAALGGCAEAALPSRSGSSGDGDDVSHRDTDASSLEGDGDRDGSGDGDGDGDGNPDRPEPGAGDGDGDVTGDGDGDGDGDSAAPGDGDGDDDDLPTDGSLPKGVPADNGWTWVEMKASKCRNGSPAGYFYRKGTENSLLIFLNGGGACADKFFCSLNPVDVDHDLPIEFLSHGAPDLFFGVREQRQQAPESGIFKRSDATNPVAKWNMIFVPYCTGDIHSGSRKDVVVKDVPGTQQFVGYLNYGLFLNSFGPTFKDSDKVLLTGSSAGGFGALFNGDRTIEYFEKDTGEKKVFIISDSGVPFQDTYMAACLQKRWREYWGLNDALPTECVGCFNADGGGIVKGYGTYLFNQKYAGRMLGGFVSSQKDEIIRGFYSPGLSATAGQPDDCTLDPTWETVQVAVIGGARYDGEKFKAGLKDVIDNVVGQGKVATYTIPDTPHMHLWRDRYYQENGNGQTIAAWVKDVLDGKATKRGEL